MHRDSSKDKNKNRAGEPSLGSARGAARKKESTTARRGPTQHRGLVRHAKILGVHRNHLYKCLIGARVSHSLMNRYHALLAKEGRA